MSLRDIFSRTLFRSPEAAKAADLKKLCRKLERLADGLDIMLEDAFEKAEPLGKEPEAVKVELIFRHLKPEDITAEVLEKNHALEFLHYLAEDTAAQLIVEVTPEKSRPFFWQDEKDCPAHAKVSITIDPNKTYAESRILLAGGPAGQMPAPSAPPLTPPKAP